MVALTSTIWRKNSVFRKNKTAKASKGRIFRPFLLLGIDNPHKVQSSLSSPIRDKKWTLVLFRPIKRRAGRWALGLTLLYLAVWLVDAYLPGVAPGFTGFPRWFEMACILTPLLFIGLCWAMVKFIYRDIPLEDDDAA